MNESFAIGLGWPAKPRWLNRQDMKKNSLAYRMFFYAIVTNMIFRSHIQSYSLHTNVRCHIELLFLRYPNVLVICMQSN